MLCTTSTVQSYIVHQRPALCTMVRILCVIFSNRGCSGRSAFNYWMSLGTDTIETEIWSGVKENISLQTKLVNNMCQWLCFQVKGISHWALCMTILSNAWVKLIGTCPRNKSHLVLTILSLNSEPQRKNCIVKTQKSIQTFC